MITVPIAQSIYCRPLVAGLPTFYNTFDGTDTARGKLIVPYCQSVGLDDIRLQIVTPDDNDQFASLYLLYDNTEVAITGQTTSYVGANKHETFIIPMSTYLGKTCRLKVVHVFNDSDPVFSHLSEPFVVQEMPTQLKLQWFNMENNFLMDYSLELVHQMYVDGELELQPYSGEESVYSNQGRQVKLKATDFRSFKLELQVPGYIAEQLSMALDHDHFYINEVEYMAEKKPNIQRLGYSNLYKFDVDLIQNTAEGINSHDAG